MYYILSIYGTYNYVFKMSAQKGYIQVLSEIRSHCFRILPVILLPLNPSPRIHKRLDPR